jgi:hypothetical protein
MKQIKMKKHQKYKTVTICVTIIRNNKNTIKFSLLKRVFSLTNDLLIYMNY